jgi:hypothetical protein
MFLPLEISREILTLIFLVTFVSQELQNRGVMHTTPFRHDLPKIVEHNRVNLETRYLDKLLYTQLDERLSQRSRRLEIRRNP